jgi:hypothetical protein
LLGYDTLLMSLDSLRVIEGILADERAEANIPEPKA